MPRQSQTTPEKDIGSPADPLELQAMLGVYAQAYDHLRHLQRMRATYFNFYMAAAGAAIAVVAALLQSGTMQLSWQSYVVLGTVITIAGVLTTARIERWTGHVAHELVTIRRLRALLTDRWPALRTALPGGRSVFWFDRPLWSPERSIEHLACILGSLGGIVVSVIAVPLPWWTRFALGSLAAVAVLGEWQAEVQRLRTKHRECCRTPPAKSTVEEESALQLS